MWWRKRRESDLERELRAHLDLEAEERGDRAAARRALGNIGLIKEDVRANWEWTWFERLWQDLRYAARVLRMSPGFTAVAVLSLALGIGANTALFSLIDAAILKTLPVRDPGRLRILTWVTMPANVKKPLQGQSSSYQMLDDTGAHVSGSFAYSAYGYLREHLPQFSDLVGYVSNQFTVTALGASELVNGQFVSGNYFTGLGAQPLMGRAIVPDDDGPAKPFVAVLTYRYWQKRFGLDPSILGQQISIDQKPFTIVGIMPPAFQGLYPGAEVDAFIPMSMVKEVGPSWFPTADPYTWWVQIFGRLRPGVTDKDAAAAVHSILAAHIQSYAPEGTIVPEIHLASGSRGVRLMEAIAADKLYVLDAILGLALLIACVNLAHLLLSRSASRSREIAVRLSIGASRARLIRQLLTENLVLAIAGGALGLVAAKPLLQLFQQLAFGARPTTLDARLDTRALVFTFGVSTLISILAGLLPAFRATRVDLGPSLKGGANTAGAAPRQYASRVLIVGQVALSVLLLAGAGLFVRTFIRLIRVDLGFVPQNLLTFQTDASLSGYKGQRLLDVYSRIRERLQTMPGVISVGLSQEGLIRGVVSNTFFTMPGRVPPGGRAFQRLLAAMFRFVSPHHGHFRPAGTRNSGHGRGRSAPGRGGQ